MRKLKSVDLQRAEESLQDFSDRFSAVMTISNAKGMWICRCTRKHVQIFIATGGTLFECLIKASEKSVVKRSELGIAAPKIDKISPLRCPACQSIKVNMSKRGDIYCEACNSRTSKSGKTRALTQTEIDNYDSFYIDGAKKDMEKLGVL